MFLSWQLWNALRFPQRRHPIFNYARKQASQKSNSRWWFVLSLLASASFIIFAIVIPVPALVITVGLAVSMPLLMILFNGTVLGIVWAIHISNTIATAFDDKRFDLLSLSSQGTYGVLWLLCSGVVHRNNRLKIVYRIVKWVLIVVLVLLGITTAMLIFGSVTASSEHLQEQQLRVLREVIQICLIVFALWLDHIQSILVAVMLGLLLPTFIKDKTQLQGITPIIYLMIQILTYLAIFLMYTLSATVLTGGFGDTFIVSLMIVLLNLLSFYLIRESIIAGLWRVILFKYDISLDEYQRTVTV